MITRRRLLTLSAAALATPARAAPIRWQGYGLGAEVSLTINASADLAEAAIQIAKSTLSEGEALFSIYQPSSALSRLNATGVLHHPDPLFLELMALVDQTHHATDGYFDPTVQPLWQALAQGTDDKTARRHIGWHHIETHTRAITLAQGQALTFNGIAQGFLTEVLRHRWLKLGLDNCLINLGEFAALGGPFTLGIADPARGLVATHELHNGAVATSSPGALTLPSGQSHIISPKGPSAQWSTVTVTAQDAGISDAASTAFCLMNREQIKKACAALPGIRSVYLVSETGTVEQLHS